MCYVRVLTINCIKSAFLFVAIHLYSFNDSLFTYVFNLFFVSVATGSEDTHTLYAISMTLALKDLFKTLDLTPPDKMFSPLNLLSVLQMVAPNFAQKDKNGALQQQV